MLDGRDIRAIHQKRLPAWKNWLAAALRYRYGLTSTRYT